MKTSVSRRLLSFALILCMIIPMLPVIEFTASSASTPTYIASIGIAQDGSSGSTGVNDCKSELSGHTIIDRDLNDGAGGDYVYMGYKTTNDPYQAITGIVFRVGNNPPESISYGGCTFYLVGGSGETNTSSQGGWIDLNGAAGGVYIYTYVTRDHNYGAPLTTITVDESSSKSGYSTGTNTSGAVIDLNQEAGGKYLYLHYKRYSATVTINFYHLNDAGKVVVTQVSGTVKHHLEEMKGKPSVPGLVTYDEKPLRRISWREDPSIENQGTSLVSNPSATVATSGKCYYATYGFLTDTLAIFPDTIIRFDANGGSGAPSELRQKDRRDVTAGTSSLIMGKLDFTLPDDTCTKAGTCKFLGWSTDKNATKATYAPGQSISIDHNTTLYAIYEPTNYVNGVCTYCGKIQDGNVAVLSKNGKEVFAGATLDAVIAEAQKCTADDKAVVTILQNIDLGKTNQYITSGVFDIDLNGFEIKSIHDGGIFNLDGDSVNVTLRDSGETGKITGAYRGILVENGSKLTVSGGTIRATSSTLGYGVDIARKSTVTISGGTISGANGVYSSSSTLTISGGTIISTGNKSSNYAVYVSGKKATISGGTISGNRGVYANGVTVTISGGTINCKYDLYYKDDGTFKLTMGQNGIGVTFPGDFATGRDSDTSFVSINKMLNTGCAYWAGDTMLSVADNVTGISAKGDITVKAACPHVSFTKQNYVNNGSNHTYTRSCCGITITEDHRIISGSCACGFACSHASGFTNGFCKENGCYEEPALVNGIYQIGNAGQLYSFAQRVNDGEYDACAVLTANIDLERRQWITICSTDLYYDTTNYSNAVYTGTFDGQGHVIRNYTVKAASYVKSSAGLFGTTLGATVKNLGVDNMSFSLNNAKDIRAAAIVGQMLDGTLIENCYVINSNLTPNSYIVGGIAACNYAGTIRNCYTYNVTISAEGRCGNLVSDTRGDISSTDRVGSVINCYTDASRVAGTQSGGKISGCTGNIPDEKFSSGEIAYKLGSAWGQTIGTQEYPVPCGEMVYQITNCKNEFLKYSNTDETIGHNWLNNNGFCTVCDAYEPAELVDGYYQITNGGNLFWFAEYINTVDRTASAKLTANINLEDRLWTPIGSTGEGNNNFRGHFDGQGYTITGLNVNANRAGAGFFGEVRLGTVENFTIHGNVTVTANNITYVGGVIGSAPGANSNQPDHNGATIRNITSYVNVTVEDDKTGVGRIGGFIGYANHETIIENCAWYGTIDLGNRSMNLGAGGFIGRVNENSAVTIRNCGAYGSIVNDSVTENVGAFMGLTNTGTNTVIENCLFAGSVSGTNASSVTPFGTWNGASKTLTNSYYINTLGTTDADAAKVSADQLASGEVAYLLGSAWGQTIGEEDSPVLGGEKVYQVCNCKNETAYSNTDADTGHSFGEDGKCTACGALLGDVSGEGRLTALDLALINAYVKEKIALTPEVLSVADFDRDGFVTSADVDSLKNYILYN